MIRQEHPAQGEVVANGRPMAYADAVSHLLEILRLRDLSDLQIDAINVACRVLKSNQPAPSVPNDVAEAARYFKAEGGHIGGLGAGRAANILWSYINDVLAAAPEATR